MLATIAINTFGQCALFCFLQTAMRCDSKTKTVVFLQITALSQQTKHRYGHKIFVLDWKCSQSIVASPLFAQNKYEWLIPPIKSRDFQSISLHFSWNRLWSWRKVKGTKASWRTRPCKWRYGNVVWAMQQLCFWWIFVANAPFSLSWCTWYGEKRCCLCGVSRWWLFYYILI